MKKNWKKILSPDLAQEIEAEIAAAYRRGWEACKARILRAVGASVPDGEGSDAGTRLRVGRNAPHGMWPREIVAVLREADGPLAAEEILERIRGRTPFAVSAGSFYHALRTLAKRGQVVKDGYQWRLS